MTEGAAQLGSVIWGPIATNNWHEKRGSNLLDGGAPWYDTHGTLEGQYMAIGPVESRFYAELLEMLGLAGTDLPEQHDRSGWLRLRDAFKEAFLSCTRDQWCVVFEGRDTCVVPVLGFSEPNNRAAKVNEEPRNHSM